MKEIRSMQRAKAARIESCVILILIPMLMLVYDVGLIEEVYLSRSERKRVSLPNGVGHSRREGETTRGGIASVSYERQMGWWKAPRSEKQL